MQVSESMQDRKGIGYWNNRENQVKYMEELAEKLNIKKMEDWYKLSNKVKNFLRIFQFLFKNF